MPSAEATATELLDQLNVGRLTAAELLEGCLQRIEAVDGQVRAFLSVAADAARQQAADIDRRRAAGQPLGALAGLPVAVKDVLCTRGQATTCASKMLEHFVPPYDATVVRRLREADAVLIGKTNMDEFAMGSSTENSAFHSTCNPWDLKRVPGGSSGGSAAAVAAGMAPLAIGTDTGGSIRQPAALCGVSGLKPTYGRVSRFGLVAFASSLDQVGPMARSAEDLALLLNVIAGHDPRDSTSAPQPADDYLAGARRPLEGLRLGLVREHFGPGLASDVELPVRDAVRRFQELGASVVDVQLPHSKYAIATYYVIAPSEASSNLARYDGVHYGYRAAEASLRQEAAASASQDDSESALLRMYRGSRSEGFGAEVQRRVMLGTYALSAGYYDKYYHKALQVRRLIRQDFDQAFEKVDLLIGPVTPTPAFRIGEKTNDPLEMYLGDLFTVGANLAGIAALSIPCGLTRQGLPVGLQLQGPPFAEQRLLQAATAYQRSTDWHLKRPKLS